MLDNCFYQVCNQIYCHIQCTGFLCADARWITCCVWGLLCCFQKIQYVRPTASLWFSKFYLCLICTDMLCKTGNNKVSWRPITCLNVRGSYKIACVLCCFFILNTKWHQRTMRIQRRKQPKEGIPAQGQILTTTKRILNFMVKHLTSQYEFILTKYLQGQFILLSMCCSDIDICSNSDINGLFLSAVF